MTSAVKIAALFLTAAAIMAAIFFFIDAGADRERAKVDKENADAINKANQGDASFSDCRNAGRVYDFETGKCRGSDRGYWKLPSWLTR